MCTGSVNRKRTSLPSLIACLIKLAEIVGVNFPAGFFQKTFGMTNQKIIPLLIDKKLSLKEIEKLIKEALPDALIEIQDLAGDGNHYSATVTSSKFSGKSKIEQHKMVYNSLKGKMGNELHALAIKTKEQ